MPNPAQNFLPRPDGTDRVSSVERANTQNIRTRDQLRDTESRISFGAVFDATETSQFAFATDALAPGATRALYLLETGALLPYTPNGGLNVTATRLSVSFRSPCVLKQYVNGELASNTWIDGGDIKDVQNAELAELAEFVNSLDGTNSVSWEIENIGDVPLEGSIIIRNLEEEV